MDRCNQPSLNCSGGMLFRTRFVVGIEHQK